MRTTKKAVEFAKWYCHVHGIKYRKIKNSIFGHGTADLQTETIFVYEDPNLGNFLSTVFHEVMHIYCKRNKIFPLYHTARNWRAIGRRDKVIIHKMLSQAYRAERKVDLLAKQEMNSYFPTIQFTGSYLKNPKESRNFLKGYIGIWLEPTEN